MSKLFLLWALGTKEIIIILLIVLLLFGGRKIPELMRGLGRGMREFKEGKDGEIKKGENEKSNRK